ncbi:6-carboxytetrahydropterin synthase [Aliikangiella sp. IMCC44359]|uniref:6-carboxytetrahydropterin synthase n=1 Tax=Aliikangiella sp. IMCC44359 TaxID=3459125 RepID=UPI00403A9B3F
MQALFVDNLTVIDFAYFHLDRGIVGESLILDVELFGELNDEGMLFDFSFVKKRIKSCVDNLVDHKFLVARQHPQINLINTPQQLTLELKTNNGDRYTHISPHQAVHLVDAKSVTPKNIIASIKNEILKILPENVTQIELALRPENISSEYYHYSHGLKKHFGDCQRIAHGHRSKIEVWKNSKLSSKWSSHIASIWKDIYLATEEDIIEEKEIDGKIYLVFQYHANQGLFELTIPKSRCFLLTTDTTVELIASYLAEYIKEKEPDSEIKIKAYEGVDKGAIVAV